MANQSKVPRSPVSFNGVKDVEELADKDLREALAHLRPRLAEVFLRHALGGETLTEIGRGWGVTESRVCQLYGEARRELRAAMAAPTSHTPVG